MRGRRPTTRPTPARTLERKCVPLPPARLLLSHARQGLLRLLPVYADHVLFPTLTESGFITEVHHVNGEGGDGGVVYCEMEARENTSYSLTSYALGRLLFPDGCGYRSETGGRLAELRASCSHAKVAAYHRSAYAPCDVRLIVSGAVSEADLLAALEPVQQKLLRKAAASFWPPRAAARPWASPVPPLAADARCELAFPSDDEAVGIARFGWLTFAPGQSYQRSALEALLQYLTSTSVSELQRAFVECQPPLAGAVYASTDDYRVQAVTITLDSVPVERLELVASALTQQLSAFAASGGAALDAARMASVLRRRRSDILSAAEEAPEDAVAAAAIPAFLYGEGDGGEATRIAMDELTRVAAMEQEPPSFWANLCEVALLQRPRCEVLGRPSAELGRTMAAAEAARVAAQRAALGEEGLAAKAAALAAAVAANEAPPPPEMLSSRFPLPLVENIPLHAVATLRSDCTLAAEGEAAAAPPPPHLAAVAAAVATLPFPAQCVTLALQLAACAHACIATQVRPYQIRVR